MPTRCRFRCTSVAHEEQTSRVVLEPVADGSPENESFFRWTPHGRLELGVVRRDQAEAFTPGCDYYIDITPCPAD